MMETYNPEPGSECQERPCRPTPALCSSAPMTVPEGAPSAASRLASVIVEPTRGTHSIRRPGSLDRTDARSKTIECAAVFFYLADIFDAFGSHLFDHVGGCAIEEFLAFELPVDIYDQFLELVVFLEQALAKRIAIYFGKLKREIEVGCGANRAGECGGRAGSD